MATAGHDGALTPTVGPLTLAQRQRLESVTFARKLLMPRTHSEMPAFHELLRLAEYINSGA